MYVGLDNTVFERRKSNAADGSGGGFQILLITPPPPPRLLATWGKVSSVKAKKSMKINYVYESTVFCVVLHFFFYVY